MATTFYVQQGASVLWQPGAATYILGITSLATTVGRSGVKYDLGQGNAHFSDLWGFQFKTKFASSPTAGARVRILLAFSTDNTNFAGAVTGSDAGYSDTDLLKQLVELRPLVADASTNAQYVVGVFRALARYVAPVIYNETAQSLSSTGTDHELAIWPLAGYVP